MNQDFTHIYPSVEAITWSADANAALSDDSAPIESDRTFVSLTPASQLAWLKMGDRQAYAFWNVSGRKILAIADIPGDIRSLVEQKAPSHFAPDFT